MTPPGGQQVIFRLQDFNRALVESRDKLGVGETPSEIRIRFGARYSSTRAVRTEVGRDRCAHSTGGAAAQLPGVSDCHRGTHGQPGHAGVNQTLSQNRAAAVKTWLVQKGQVPDGCIITSGFGQTRPIAPNTTAAGRQKNRRVEVRLLKASAPEK